MLLDRSFSSMRSSDGSVKRDANIMPKERKSCTRVVLSTGRENRTVASKWQMRHNSAAGGTPSRRTGEQMRLRPQAGSSRHHVGTRAVLRRGQPQRSAGLAAAPVPQSAVSWQREQTGRAVALCTSLPLCTFHCCQCVNAVPGIPMREAQLVQLDPAALVLQRGGALRHDGASGASGGRGHVEHACVARWRVVGGRRVHTGDVHHIGGTFKAIFAHSRELLAHLETEPAIAPRGVQADQQS